MRRGLYAAVSIKMVDAPVFQGQTKEKLMTPEARTVVSQLLMANFEKSISKKDVKTIVDRALIEQKLRTPQKRAVKPRKRLHQVVKI